MFPGNNTAYMQKMHENHEACAKQTGVNKELTKKAFEDGVFTDDPKLKCYLKCIFENTGRMDSNGNVDFSKCMEHIPESPDKAKITAEVTKCQSSKGTDACDTAFIAAKCFRAAVGGLKH